MGLCLIKKDSKIAFAVSHSLYSRPDEEKQPVCMPRLRLEFIFLRRDTFLVRAKRAVRNQREPMLVSSFKAHLKAINSIGFINLPKILFT